MQSGTTELTRLCLLFHDISLNSSNSLQGLKSVEPTLEKGSDGYDSTVMQQAIRSLQRRKGGKLGGRARWFSGTEGMDKIKPDVEIGLWVCWLVWHFHLPKN